MRRGPRPAVSLRPGKLGDALACWRRGAVICALLIVSPFTQTLPAQENNAGLALAANGMTEGVLHQGWPLILVAQANLEDGESAQFAWPAPVRLTIRNASGDVTWPLKLASPSVDAITVSEGSPAVAVWTLSPEETAAIPPGDYTIRAEHPSANSSRLILLTVSGEPAELTPEQGSLKARLRSRFHEWTDTKETALRILTEWLDATPGDIGALADKSDLLADMEQFAEALDCADKALTAFTEQFMDAKHPPAGLLRRIRSLEARLPEP